MATILDSAVSYANADYRVIPLRGKIPRTAHGSHDATTDEQTIRAWWRQWPTADIGLTLDGLVCVDIDPRNGGSVSALPDFPATCIAKTGGGGWHYLFRAQPGSIYPGKYGAGVDIKTGGGAYIVAAPSLHASGSRYEWIRSPLDTEPAPAPDWLASLAIVPRPRKITRSNIVTPKAPEPELPGWKRLTPTLAVKTFHLPDSLKDLFK